MHKPTKNIQQQYQGFVATPPLWIANEVYNFPQFVMPQQATAVFDDTILENVLLGKRVESFVYKQLQDMENVTILSKNAQIQNGKITIGELDSIIKQDETPIHLEIVYKFYLYDPAVGTTELAHWIGPNRKDSLVQKLDKLKEKQLPLLFNEHTEPLLASLKLDPLEMQQQVCFKAQLFIPYQLEVSFQLLNKNCLQGFYIPHKELVQFSDCKFYMPKKTDWLLEVQTQVAWISYEVFTENITVFLQQEIAPLCWIKFPNGSLQKFFVVWW